MKLNKHNKNKNIRLLKGDYFLVAFVLIVIILLFLPSFKKQDNLTAVIYENGEIFKKIDLTHVDKNYKIICQGCEIFVEKGKISFFDSDCRDKLCVKRGKLTNSGDTMACIPNRVVITVKGEKSDSFDAIAY